jgi:hypothetical protein
MSDEEAQKAHFFTDPTVHSMLMSVAEKAAERGAQKAVKDSFFLIGVDLEDIEDVDLFRNNMRTMRSANENKREQKREVFKGITTFATAILISIATSLGAIYVRLGGITPH